AGGAVARWVRRRRHRSQRDRGRRRGARPAAAGRLMPDRRPMDATSDPDRHDPHPTPPPAPHPARRTTHREAMTRPLFRGLVILAATLAISLASTTPASANFPSFGQVYDTVDAVQSDSSLMTITGIVVGQSTATTSSYRIAASPLSSEDGVARCDRF